MPEGLPRRIKLAFIVQALIGSLLITLGILLAGLLVRQHVLTDRMQREADAFWEARRDNPAHPLPTSATMTGYLERTFSPNRDLPDRWRALGEGLHPFPLQQRMVFVDHREQGTLYLVFSSELVDMAILYTGLASLLLSLLATYLISWFTYKTSKRLVIPVAWLADVVSRWDPRDPDAGAIRPQYLPLESGTEVHDLARALSGLADRVAEFVQRERDFTRDASHELRTPLTVIRVATDLMLGDPETPKRSLRSLARVQRAGRDMEAVIDAFLILAREADVVPQSERFDVREVVHEEIERMRPLLLDKPVALDVVDNGAPQLFAPPHVLHVMVGNLLSNAARFTDEGRIEVVLERDRIEIRDSGIGMTDEALARVFDPFYRVDTGREEGRGMGLSIVRRLGERFGWPVRLSSRLGEGTTATIQFAN
jgi:signal transduction histidine kinase